MTGTADGGAGHPFESSDAQKYFRAIEELFTGLRGAPLLLAPADWRVAKAWYEAGIPLELVAETLEELTNRRLERDSEERINSLRYFDRAVRAAWKSLEERRGPAFEPSSERAAPGEDDLAARLAGLADRLPPDLEGRDEWAERIRDVSGSLRAREEALGDLDSELLDAAEDALPAAERRRIEMRVEEAVRRLGTLPGGDDLAELRRRLFRRELRERTGLPLLTLF